MVSNTAGAALIKLEYFKTTSFLLYTLLDTALLFIESKISTLLVFNILVLSTELNDNSNASYNIEASTFWNFNILYDVAFILSLLWISTALVRTRRSIWACRIPMATFTSALGYLSALSDLSNSLVSTPNIVS